MTTKSEKIAASIVTSILKQKMYGNSFDISNRTDHFRQLTVDRMITLKCMLDTC